jgi:hypothetical protein
MSRRWTTLLLGATLVLGSLLSASQAYADHWRYRPRGTVVGFSVAVGAPTVVYPAPVVVYEPAVPVIVRPAPVIVVDPWCPPPVPVYYSGRATGIYLGSSGFGFYYERWR